MKRHEALPGTCRSCGKDLVHVPGERTYHPASVTWSEGNYCRALLYVQNTTALSRDVPDSEFVPNEEVEHFLSVVETDEGTAYSCSCGRSLGWIGATQVEARLMDAQAHTVMETLRKVGL